MLVCLRTISVMKAKPVPFPTNMTHICRVQTESTRPESALVKGLADGSHRVTALVTKCRCLGLPTPEAAPLEAGPVHSCSHLLPRWP